MQALLMHPDRDFDTDRALPAQAEVVRRDLELDTLLAAMGNGDELIPDVARIALLGGAGNDATTIHYRQAALRDALAHPETVRELYGITLAAIEEKRKGYWGFAGHYPSSVLYGALQVMRLFVQRLRAMRGIAETAMARFESAGFRNLFAMLQRELDDSYLARVDTHLAELRFAGGALVSARLGPDCESADCILRRSGGQHPCWLKRLLERAPSEWTVKVAERDMVGAKTLREMRDRGINDVANALAQSADHIEGFFRMLRTELAFYVGCINLHERLAAKGVQTCLPEPRPGDGTSGFSTRGLRDVSLVLAMDAAVITNDIDADGKRLMVVTGANQGGKSTFLRGFGLAQLMLHAGMFVAATSFASTLCTGLFTHYKREEDAAMNQGKLDEELARIGEIADAIRPGAWLLCNESFASTNEREGSELGRQMVEALCERDISVAFVTHLYAFAHELHEQRRDDALFLRAERRDDGSRSFRLAEGAPRETSYGEDLYRGIFGRDAPQDVHAAEPEAIVPSIRDTTAGAAR